MLYKVNAIGTIDPKSEMHYRFHQKIDSSIYPQVHDFYEISLITNGKMELELNQKKEILHTGALFLIRPGDVHTRKAEGPCSYINLAFPSEVVTEMFQYLDIPEMQNLSKESGAAAKDRAVVRRSDSFKGTFGKIKSSSGGTSPCCLYGITPSTLDIMLQYFLPDFLTAPQMNCPGWI